MPTGYTRPLYLLPFDHRASYISGLFGWKEPLKAEQMVTVANSKHVIYAGFQQALADGVPKERAGILVATMGKLPYTELKGATFTHPTLAERPNSLFLTLDL